MKGTHSCLAIRRSQSRERSPLLTNTPIERCLAVHFVHDSMRARAPPTNVGRGAGRMYKVIPKVCVIFYSYL